MLWKSSSSFSVLLPEKSLELCVMDEKVPSFQCYAHVLLFQEQYVILVLTFLFFVFAQYTNLYLDTVTLKKSDLCKVSDLKRGNGYFISFCIPVHIFCSKGFVYLCE